MRVGIFDHFGWAVAVTATGTGEVVDRRRIELLEADVGSAPIHHEGKDLDVEATAKLVADVEASIRRAAAVELDALPETPESFSLREWPADFPTDIEVQKRVPWEARADAIMYRKVLAELAEQRGWPVHFYNFKTVLADATAILGDRAEDALEGPKQRLGAPWTKDHRIALAATIVAANTNLRPSAG